MLIAFIQKKYQLLYQMLLYRLLALNYLCLHRSTCQSWIILSTITWPDHEFDSKHFYYVHIPCLDYMQGQDTKTMLHWITNLLNLQNNQKIKYIIVDFQVVLSHVHRTHCLPLDIIWAPRYMHMVVGTPPHPNIHWPCSQKK